MPVTGDLTDLGVADLLYLLKLRGVTGQLVLQRGQEDAVVEFRDGRPIRITSSRVSRRLGELLVQRGTLTAEQLAQVLAQQAAGQGSAAFGTVLMEHSLVAREDLDAVLTCQAEDILQRLLAWPDGTFAYKLMALPVVAVPLPEINIEQLILDSYRQADEANDGAVMAVAPSDGEVTEEDEAWTLLSAQAVEPPKGHAPDPSTRETAPAPSSGARTIAHYLSRLRTRLSGRDQG